MSLRTMSVRFGVAMLAALAVSLTPAANAADKYLPEKSEIVFSINFKPLIESELSKKFNAESELRKHIDSQPEAQKVLKALNFDPFKDVQSVTVAASGIKLEGRGGQPNIPDEILFIVRGSFKQAQVEAVLATQDVPVTTQGNFKIYELQDKAKNNDQKLYATFADSNTILASLKKDCVATALTRGSSQLNKEMAGILGKTDDKAVFWGAIAMTGSIKDAVKNNPQAAQAANFEGLSMTVNVKSDVKLELLIHAGDAAAAKELQGQLQQVVGFLPALVQGNPDVPPAVVNALNTLRVGSNDKAVSLTLEMSAEAIEKLIEAGKNAQPGKKPSSDKKDKDKSDKKDKDK